MKLLEDRVLKDGKIFPGEVVKVDSFLNHQIDTGLSMEMAKEIYRLFKDSGVTKVLTVEASGIALASFVSYVFGVPMVFAKKSRSANIAENTYRAEVHSYTYNKVNTIVCSKEYLNKDDKVLLVDDFLATGNAFIGLAELVGQAGGEVCGAVAAVEKVFQGGYKRLQDMGIHVESLCRIGSITGDSIEIYKE